MKKITVIDGQGGKMGRAIIEQLKKQFPRQEILAVGTNSTATAAMLKAGADFGATGENPVIVAARDSDLIIGPIGGCGTKPGPSASHAGEPLQPSGDRRGRFVPE